MPSDAPAHHHHMRRQYGYSPLAANAAADRITGILSALAHQLRKQLQIGSTYFVTNRLSALDIYWACFSNIFSPLPHNLNPMPESLRAHYKDIPGAIDDALDPILLEHRDRVFKHHIGLPLDF